MKSATFLYIVLAVVVIGGGVLLIKGGEENIVSNNQEKLNPELATDDRGVFSMRDLVERGEPVSCTFVHDTETSRSSGEVFVAKGKVRGNFDVSALSIGSQPFKAYMIIVDDESYVWSSVISQGIKMPISQIESQDPDQAADGISYNSELDYYCLPWSVDSSVFVPPTSVKFVEAP